MLLPREKERNTVSKKRAVRKIFRDVFFGGQELIMVGKKEERVARRRRDVTSDARRFLSRIGRRLRYSLSLSPFGGLLSLGNRSFVLQTGA